MTHKPGGFRNFTRESYVLGIFEQVIWHLLSTHAFVWLLMRGKENLIKIDYFVDYLLEH